jgi:signal transduction histidine kinase
MVVVSVVVAVILAFISLHIRVHHLTTSRMSATIVAASIMGGAMAGTHYTAMRAALFFPLPNANDQGMALSPTPLALLVALFTVLIILVTLGAAFAGRQNELALSLTAEIAAHKRDQERLVVSMKAAEDANKAKTEFLANMAHELRTPLNAIIGFSEIMDSGTFGRLPDKYADYASMIHESGTHLLAIINDILDTTNTETGTLTLQESRVDPAEIVTFTSKIIGDMAAGAGIAYSVNCADPLPALRADGAKLRQILINLLSNAIKFTPGGGWVKLTVRYTPECKLEFRVEDNGIGIPAHMMAVALSPFGRIDSNLARRYGGVGLGLPLTKRLVELHGGIMEIDSVPDQGTVVTVRLPAWRATQPNAVAESFV